MSLEEVVPDKETSLGHPYPFTSGCGVKVVRYDAVPTPGLPGGMCKARLATPMRNVGRKLVKSSTDGTEDLISNSSR